MQMSVKHLSWRMIDRLGLRSRLRRMNMVVLTLFLPRCCSGSHGSEHPKEDELAAGKESFGMKVDEAHLAAPESALLAM
jgi:hypothetical protein